MIELGLSIFASSAFRGIEFLCNQAEFLCSQRNQQHTAKSNRAELQRTARFRSELLEGVNTGNAIELIGTSASVVALCAKLYDRVASASRARAAAEREVWLEGLRAANNRELLRLAYDLQRETVAWGATVNNYPFLRGPGMLRRKLELSGGIGAPVVLLPALRTDVPPHPWAGLPARIRAELAPYEGPLLQVELTDRHFEWPDPDLLRHDLDGITVVVLDPIPLGGTLDFRIGGAHIFPQSVLQILPMAGTGTLAVSGDQAAAARAAAFRIVRAVDCVHLMRSRAHGELIDDAAARYRADQEWPADHGLPLSLLVDPAYHLLHRAARLLRRGDMPGADQALADALTCLGASDKPSRPPWPALITSAARSGEMWRHHIVKLLDILQERFPGEGLDQYLRDPRLAGESAPVSPVPAYPEAEAADSWMPRGQPPLL